MSTIFSKIIAGEIPSDQVYSDDRCIAFRDINPTAPVHILVIPRQEIAQLGHMTEDHEGLVGHLMRVAGIVARQEGYEDFRVIINNGAGAGQTVFHLHLHVVAGRTLSWPPG
ncbi:MAG: histidine triad nucleotide-binding protein [Myxococcales bacterium]|nr:histidine triad nucleotide-binding protein [Myxococcales bacterium]